MFRHGPSPGARLLLYLALALFLMVADTRLGLTGPLRSVVASLLYPLQWLAAQPVLMASQGLGYFQSVDSARSELEQTRQAMAQMTLRAGQAELLLRENAELRELLVLRQRLNTTTRTAQVLYDTPDPYTRRVIIDQGRLAGIAPGSPVMDAQGVLGQVTRVDAAASEITLLIDRDQAIPVLNVRTGARSLAYGNPLAHSGGMELRFTPGNADVQQGDLLTTSGIDGVYPPACRWRAWCASSAGPIPPLPALIANRWRGCMARAMSWCSIPSRWRCPSVPPRPSRAANAPNHACRCHRTAQGPGRRSAPMIMPRGQPLLMPARPAFIALSLLLALLLVMLPLGRVLWTPDWLLLVLVFWGCTSRPGSAWGWPLPWAWWWMCSNRHCWASMPWCMRWRCLPCRPGRAGCCGSMPRSRRCTWPSCFCRRMPCRCCCAWPVVPVCPISPCCWHRCWRRCYGQSPPGCCWPRSGACPTRTTTVHCESPAA